MSHFRLYNRLTKGGSSFMAKAIKMRNNLPPHLKKQGSLQSFKRALGDEFYKEKELLFLP